MADRKPQGGRPAGAGGAARPPAGNRPGASQRNAPAAAPSRQREQENLPPPPTGPRPTPRLQTRYLEEVRPSLIQEFSYANMMQAPKVDKVVINIGMGEALLNSNALDAAVADLEKVTGQRPVVTRAKKSIAAFKLREGQSIGCMVTLRGARMYDFLDKLFSVALPRVRDFSGVSPDAFDGRGNYNLGLREQLIFPEIEFDKVDRVRGMEIALVTTARTDDEGRRLLALMGMPFRTGPARSTEDAGAPRRRSAAGGARR